MYGAGAGGKTSSNEMKGRHLQNSKNIKQMSFKLELTYGSRHCYNAR